MTDDMPTRIASPLRVPMRRLHPLAPLPTYAHLDDAGADLCVVADVRLEPGERILVGTGVAISLPPGYAGFVHPRSGLAARMGLSIVNAPGTIDAGYTGEIKVCLVNLDPEEPISLAAGDRIAQLVIQTVEHALFVEVDDFDLTARGDSGHGSSGGVSAWRRLDPRQEG